VFEPLLETYMELLQAREERYLAALDVITREPSRAYVAREREREN
jgi:hypothetical protein